MRENRQARDEPMQQKEAVMGVCWILMILLYCVSSHATQCPLTNVSYGQLKFYYVTEEKCISVFVPCPNVAADDKTFKLFKDQTMIYSCRVNQDKPKCPLVNGSNLDVQFENKGKLPGFTANVTSQAVYTCEVQVFDPPPFKTTPHEQVVIVHKEGCNKTTGDEKEATGSQMFLWIWIGVVALLSTYSLAVTIVALLIWFKLKNADNQSDYMNTKPKPSRPRKNKNKVQNPVPRYF